MPANQQPRESQSTIGMATVATLLLAGLGVVAPIAWDWYKARSALELREVGRTIIVGGVAGMAKLQLSYDGQPVTSLSKNDLVVSNAGRTPIRATDVSSPVTIAIDSGRILDVKVERTIPIGVVVQSRIDSARKSVALSMPLLNPGDQVGLSLLVSSTAPAFTASARIAGLPALTSIPLPPRDVRIRRDIGWQVWVVGAFTALSFLLVLLGLYFVGQENAMARLWKAGAIVLPENATAADLLAYVNGAIRHSGKDTDFDGIRQQLRVLPQGEQVSAPTMATLRQGFGHAMLQTAGMRALGFLSMFTIIGLVYCAYRLFGS